MLNCRMNAMQYPRWNQLRAARASLIALALAGVASNPSLARSATTGSFTFVQPMKQFRRQQTATLLLDGRVLVAGGAPFLPAAISEIYDPIAENWTSSGSLTTW